MVLDGTPAHMLGLMTTSSRSNPELTTPKSDLSARALDIMRDCQAILTDGHFVYTSGRHGSVYINKDAVYPHTYKIAELGAFIAQHLCQFDVDVVAGPALGGIIMSQWTAHHLGVPGVFAERREGELVFARGYDKFLKGKRVAVVEDILTTGLSARQTVEAVEAAGGTVVAVCALFNRGGIKASELGAPELSSLIEMQFDDYAADECPLCAKGIPINTDVGKGAKGTVSAAQK